MRTLPLPSNQLHSDLVNLLLLDTFLYKMINSFCFIQDKIKPLSNGSDKR